MRADDWGAYWKGLDLIIEGDSNFTPPLIIPGVSDKDPIYRLPPVKRDSVFVGMSQTMDYGLELLGIPTVWKNSRGKGIKVAILDTGVDLSHPDLDGAIAEAQDFTGSPSGPQDVNGHGCIDPEAEVHTSTLGLTTIKEFYESVGTPEVSQIINGIEYLSKHIPQPVTSYSYDPVRDSVILNHVESVHKVPIKGKVVKLILEGHIEMMLTPWHPLYIKTSDDMVIRVRADELVEGQSVKAVPPEIARHLVHPKKYQRSLVTPNNRKLTKKIKSIEIMSYEGYFYDFTMKNQQYNNYLARGVFVSNTHVAGIVGARDNSLGVVGVAPECQLLIGKVLADSGAGTGEWIAAAVYWAVERGAQVISMSLGSPQPSRAMYEAIKFAISKGVFIVCAAGNEGPSLDTVGYPAKFPETIAVGSVDRGKNISRFSSRGKQVDLVAPGDDILSTYPPKGYAKLSGTSMATPSVAGAVALMLASPDSIKPKNQEELLTKLKESAIDLGDSGFDTSFGYGLINPVGMVHTLDLLTLRKEDFTQAGLQKIYQICGPTVAAKGSIILDCGRKVLVSIEPDSTGSNFVATSQPKLEKRKWFN